MHRIRAPRIILPGLAAVTLVGAFAVARSLPARPTEIPERLSDTTFWQLTRDLSEPSGYFHSDNFVSNESAYQYVIPELLASPGKGGVYVGVGPDQNFTYLVALQPRIAFIVDIRRQNMMQHLMYKALLEMSDDRLQFLSRLFARATPEGIPPDAPIDRWMTAFSAVPPDSMRANETLAAILENLTKRHRFGLSTEDRRSIEYVYLAFARAGPELTYTANMGRMGFTGAYPTYGWLMAESDRDGLMRSYLASEENFRVLKDLEARNLVVPLVGNFAGDHALRGVGGWLRRHGAAVSVFYTSNVEQYLFQQDDEWSRFYKNVATMPIADAGTFIRSVTNRRWVVSQNPNSRSAQMLSSIRDLLKAFSDGSLQSYYDVVAISHQ